MWLSPKWFCFLFIYFVLYHGPEASKVQIKLTYLLTTPNHKLAYNGLRQEYKRVIQAEKGNICSLQVKP